MTNKRNYIISELTTMWKVFLIAGLFCLQIYAQQRQNFLNRANTKNQVPAVQNVFTQIESAIATGNVSMLSKYFSPHTYFSLSNGVSGYFSSNQAYYILEDYFKIYQVISFKFNDIQAAEDKPYGIGVYNFEFKGKRDNSKVYISLKNNNNDWKITQITIN